MKTQKINPTESTTLKFNMDTLRLPDFLEVDFALTRPFLVSMLNFRGVK